MKNLVIVESPTKARTLSQYLGKGYEITASMGHMRDLPRGEFGVDVEKGFKPKYVIPKEKIKNVNALAKEASTAENIWLATDPDREGEAIAWNLVQIIHEKSREKKKGKKAAKVDEPKYQRVVFHEITKDAVMDAFEHPRDIDNNLVEAQQARRVLDRLVGYKLSPLLWKKVKSGLSAGRVQSVALRLVVDREREIEKFKPVEYWVVSADLTGKSEKGEGFNADLVEIGDKKAEISDGKAAEKVVSDLEKANYKILEIRSKDVRKYPSPPYTTSTLQQSAANKFGFVPKRTMRLAQDLYEKGFITYMRTDSVNLSEKAVGAIRKFVSENFGKDYLPEKARGFKVKSKLAQEAHEAIRPTDVSRRADDLHLVGDHKKLYDLIWRRAIVCQMVEAIVSEGAVDVEALRDSSKYLLRANGQKVKFDGWYKIYDSAPINEQMLPNVKEGEEVDLVKVNSEQKFTEAPARYSEATLIRDLEKHDIGRPSTYAPTISTLYDRAYIERLEAKKIGPTPVAKTTVDFLVEYFPDIFDLSFTAEMENDLDEIAQGKKALGATMEKFWGPFEKKVESVTEKARKVKVAVEVTDEICEKCGKPMVIRYGRFGKFMACSGFPDCKNTKTLADPTGLICPLDDGEVVVKRTKRGRSFWGCANYPECKYASWKKPMADASGKVIESKKVKVQDTEKEQETESGKINNKSES